MKRDNPHSFNYGVKCREGESFESLLFRFRREGNRAETRQEMKARMAFVPESKKRHDENRMKGYLSKKGNELIK